MEHKKAIENGTPVYFCLHYEFYKCFFYFWASLLLCSVVSNILKTCFRGSEELLKNCDSHGNFGYLKENQTFYSKRKL